MAGRMQSGLAPRLSGTELELRNQLAVCLEHCPAPVAMFDRDMRYLGASRRWLIDYGIQGDVIGRSHYDVQPEIPERWKEVHRRCLHGAVESCEEDTFVRADGSIDWVRWEVRPWRDSLGEVGGVLIFTEVISDRKSAEAAERSQRESEERLRLAVSGADIGIWHWTVGSAALVWSERCCTMFGIPAGTAMTYSIFLAAVHPEDRSRVDAAIRHAVSRPGDYDLQVRSLWPDGSVHWVDLKGRVYGDEHGKAVRMEGVALDVTSRKCAEYALRQSEEQLRNLVDGVPHLIHQLAPDGRVLYTNKRWRDYFPRWGASTIGEPTPEEAWRELIHPADLSSVIDEWTQVSRGQLWTRDVRFKGPDGTFRWFSARTLPVYDEFGKLDYVVGTATDIDELKQTEAALLESRARLQAALRAGGMGTSVWDLQEGRMHWDDSLLHLLGRAQAEVEHAGIDGVLATVHPEDRPFVQRTLDRTLEHGTDYELEYRAVRPDGAILWVASKGRVERDTHGRALRVVSAVMDITRHKHVERELYEARKLEAVGQLAGGVAHDFNNVLTVILNQASLLAARSDVAPDVIQEVRGIMAAAERGAGITAQLLAFGRRRLLQLEDVDLSDIVEEALGLLRSTLGERIELTFERWPLPVPVRADPGMLGQVLLNLALNARDAMPRGGRLAIRTRLDTLDDAAVTGRPELSAGTWACLEVSDTGHGIAPDVLAHVFEPFFTTKPVGDGTGLGLASVYGIVKQHRGSVTIDTRPDQGTTFRVLLPIGTLNVNERPSTPPPDQLPVGRDELILLVEDEPAVRALLVRTLELHGYRVLAADNASSALNVWRGHVEEIALLLSDVVMPGDMTGLELAERLRAQNPALRVVLSSGHGAGILGDRPASEHGLAFLPKPYSIRELLRVVAGQLAERGAPQR